MVQILPTLLAAAIVLQSAMATNLYVNTGCIWEDRSDRKVCQGNPITGIQIAGPVDILACIDRARPRNQYWCRWVGNVPTNWDRAYWGADNCMYSAGSNPIQLGCAVSAHGYLPVNVY